MWADCLDFERIATPRPTLDEGRLRQALARCRDPFLDGDSAPWAGACRERLRAHFLHLADLFGTHLERAGDGAGAVDAYLHAIDVEPEAEGLYRRLMNADAQLGRHNEARAVYQRCRQSLLSRQGITPALETQALYRQIAEG